MHTVTLNNGVLMPMVGYGLYQIPKGPDCTRCVGEAIEAGYRLIDTATYYQNESSVGEGLRQSGLPRDQLFVTSKVWVHQAGFEGTVQAIHDSLRRLRLDYLDLFLIHQPFGDVHGSWRAMEQAYKAGKLRAIGVSNFQPERLMDIIAFNEIRPTINQIEINPFYQREDELTFMRAQGIQAQAWAPFAEGRRNLFQNDILLGVAAKHGKTVAQVVLRWLMQRGIATLAKTVHSTRMAENLAVFNFELDAQDMAALLPLDTGSSAFYSHRDPATVLRVKNKVLDQDP